jgi:hypothetical protein
MILPRLIELDNSIRCSQSWTIKNIVKFLVIPDDINIAAVPYEERKVPATPSVYFLFTKQDALVYIGRSVCPRNRLKVHSAEWWDGQKYFCLPVDHEFLELVETFYIHWMNPIKNGHYVGTDVEIASLIKKLTEEFGDSIKKLTGRTQRYEYL